MATIIDLGDSGFIAGDPPEELDLGQHWCEYCAGDGLEDTWDGDIQVCTACYGVCVTQCEDTACLTHSALHPQ